MKNIKVNIPDGHVIDTENSDLEKGIITFKKEESKYPMELMDLEFFIQQYYWSRYAEGKNDSINTTQLVEKYETFIRLVETCKEWNRIDGFEANWRKGVYCIVNTESIIIGDFVISKPLNFKDKKTAELFLETFREEIELVKDLI